MNVPVHVSFVGGATGPWGIDSISDVVGETLPAAERLIVVESGAPRSGDVAWCLRGVVSNEQYVTSAEQRELVARQPKLGRAQADRAALIPIRKTAAWWALAQDERRAVFDERSKHITVGLKYLSAVTRRLHHCRDLVEPFDFPGLSMPRPTHLRSMTSCGRCAKPRNGHTSTGKSTSACPVKPARNEELARLHPAARTAVGRPTRSLIRDLIPSARLRGNR